MTINRWGQDIKRGAIVMVQPANGERYTTTIKRVLPVDRFSRAYGRQALTAYGQSVCIDDCSIATPRDLFRTKLRSVQMASDTHDYILMHGCMQTSREYTGRVTMLAFLGTSAADVNRALHPQDQFAEIATPTSFYPGEHSTTRVATPTNRTTGCRMAVRSMRHDIRDQCIMFGFTGRMSPTFETAQDRRNALAFVGLPLTQWEV